MKIRKTYWIASLSLLLSLSLALPYCCDADISELFSHQTEMPAEAAHGMHSGTGDDTCDCGHEFVKDFQKTKKAAAGQNALLLLSGFDIETSFVTPFYQSVLQPVRIRPGILADAGPPIHLLNNIFLN